MTDPGGGGGGSPPRSVVRFAQDPGGGAARIAVPREAMDDETGT